jgi:CheY-like chemotaxis protein
MLAYALALTGYETVVAHDGPTALRLIETVTPDAAFLDIGLPVMDGYELATRLRSTPGLARIRLIAVTGYGQESDRKRSAAAGFDYHLVKPVSLDQITEVVAQLLAGPDHDRMPPSEARS